VSHRDGKVRKKVLKAPWIPEISDPMDICHFQTFEEAEEEGFGESNESSPVAEGRGTTTTIFLLTSSY
jgi:hypothetical protein